MKKLKLVMLLVFSLSLVTFSCSSDDDNNNDGNPGGGDGTMTINGETFSIATGVLESYGENSDGSFDWDIVLLSDGFTINTSQQTITGIGAYLYLDLNTNSATGLVPGTYNYADERAEFTWVDAGGSPNVNAETFEGTFFAGVSGTITITGTGSSQVITVNIVDTDGNPITASFSGDLQFIYLDDLD
jgi:hypothetical protein